MSYLLKKKKKKSVLLTRAELKSVETTLAILSRNEFKYRELGAYKISGGGGGACPRLGGRYDSPKGPPGELLPGEESGGPAGTAGFRSTVSLPQPSRQEAATSVASPHHQDSDRNRDPTQRLPPSPGPCLRLELAQRTERLVTAGSLAHMPPRSCELTPAGPAAGVPVAEQAPLIAAL